MIETAPYRNVELDIVENRLQLARPLIPAEAEQLRGYFGNVYGKETLLHHHRLEGGLLGLSEKTIEFQSGKDPLKLDRSGFYELTLSDGSRLGVTGPRVEEGHLVAETRFGATIRPTLSEVMRLHARTPSVVYLSERTVPAGNRNQHGCIEVQ